jgi:integrase
VTPGYGGHVPRRPTGALRHRDGHRSVRITLTKDERPSIPLPSCRTDAEAEARREVLCSLTDRLRGIGRLDLAKPLLVRAGAASSAKSLRDVVTAVDAICAGNVSPRGAATTFREFAEAWTKGDLHRAHPDHVREKRSVSGDVYRLQRHVYPVVEGLPIAAFELEHAERVMRALPGKLSPGSRRQVAQLMHRILSLAVFPARVLKSNPLPRGFLPSVGKGKAMTYLYPSEDAKLLACPSVPMAYRLLYGFLAREGLRTSEAAGLRWRDLDLRHGAITLDENKTDDPRAWSLNPGVACALALWREERDDWADDDQVFTEGPGQPINMARLAQTFRAHLHLAKVDRTTLFEKSAVRQPVRAHDLRATFVTLGLAHGRTEAWVQDRTGHQSSIMLNRYRRAARTVAELALGDMLPLHKVIPEIEKVLKRYKKSGTGGGIGRRSGFRFHRREA